MSRRKPDESNQKLMRIISFLARNNFPLDTVSNHFVKKLIKNKMLEIDQNPESSNLDRSGSKASYPKPKSDFQWYEKLDDVPK